MSEEEYIDATNLAKLEAIERLLRDVHAEESDLFFLVRNQAIVSVISMLNYCRSRVEQGGPDG